MAKFRKKPVVIEAVQWTGDKEAIREFIDLEEFPASPPIAYQPPNRPYFRFDKPEGTVAISTLEGVMHASPGDWIIKGVKGEKYPCKPDIFKATYEPVEDE